MHSKIEKFAQAMQKEIDDNSHKGDWETFLHLNKLETILQTDENPELVKEYIADCGNILMMLGNYYKLYN